MLTKTELKAWMRVWDESTQAKDMAFEAIIGNMGLGRETEQAVLGMYERNGGGYGWLSLKEEYSLIEMRVAIAYGLAIHKATTRTLVRFDIEDIEDPITDDDRKIRDIALKILMPKRCFELDMLDTYMDDKQLAAS